VARVIKGGGGGAGAKAPRPPTRVVMPGDKKKVIGRELFQAKLDAEQILQRAEEARHARLAEGRKQAAQAREEAMTQGASEAFAAAAAEALAAFRKRADRYAEAAEDIRALALEVARKVLGSTPDLGPKDVDAILRRGLAHLRARRKLRVQVSDERLHQLASERPNLMKALEAEPDLLVEATDDVGEGFARVVTEVGGALCAEATALDALAQAVNVLEQPRIGRQHTGRTHVGTRPTDSSLEQMRRMPVDDLPNAAFEEDDGGGAEETINLATSKKKPPRYDPSSEEPDPALSDDIEEIIAEEDESKTMPRGARVPPPAGVRPSTRVVPIASTSASEGDDDGDLELFTDEKVPPKKRR
jgi:flagellar biosynthesis/type III secretory pathway protein FliH